MDIQGMLTGKMVGNINQDQGEGSPGKQDGEEGSSQEHLCPQHRVAKRQNGSTRSEHSVSSCPRCEAMQKQSSSSSNDSGFANHEQVRYRHGDWQTGSQLPSCQRSISSSSSSPSSHGRALTWKQRIRHTTWAYFTLTMATGGIANVLHSLPSRYRPEWVVAIGLCFFLLNILLYVMIWAMILTRFLCFPGTFRESLVHPTESLFVPAFSVSLNIILMTIVQYGASTSREWLIKAVLALFWCDLALSLIISILIYLVLWSSLTFTIAQMTPVWIFPAYPLLIMGPHAANLAPKLSQSQSAIKVIIGGFTVQGIGWLVSLTMYSAFVYRLMTQKLPADPSRPGMFVSVGPAAFTCSGLMGMAAALPQAIGQTDNDVFQAVPSVLAAQVLRLVGDWAGLWFWGLALWFFFVSLIANIAPLWAYWQDKNPEHKISFAMTWFSYIFPQTALITSTLWVGKAFNLNALMIVGTVMSGLLIAMWFFVVGMMIRAVLRREILWPDVGEDKDEGGYVRGKVEKAKKPGKIRNIGVDRQSDAAV